MTHSVQDVAQWMLDQVRTLGTLDQEEAAYQIQSKFGEEFVYSTEYGGLAIDKRVLRAFRRLTENEVVWARFSRYWRMRAPGDAYGRQQDESSGTHSAAASGAHPPSPAPA
jgi:hypothetical protein